MLPSQKSNPTHWPSIWQFALSTLVVLLLWGIAAIVFLLGLYNTVTAGLPTGSAYPLIQFAAANIAAGMLVTPSAFFALLRLLGRPSRTIKPPRGWAVLAFLGWLVVLGLGAWLSGQPEPAWLILPWLHMLAIGLPILLLVHLGRRGLPSGSPQRVSGTLASGLVIGPTIILAAEFLLMLGVLIVGIVYLFSQPELLEQLSDLSNQILQGELSPEQLGETLLPNFLSPGVMLGIIAFAGLAVPLIEEAFKPIGVWMLLLGRRKLSPAEGFSLGLVSGAGFALFESFLANAGIDSWLAVVTARSGTAAVHLFTAGLVGWALAATWRDRRFLRLLGTYLLAVAIHGLWNSLTALAAFNQAGTLGAFSILGKVAPIILILLAITCLFGLSFMNRRLRSANPPQATTPVVLETPPAGML